MLQESCLWGTLKKTTESIPFLPFCYFSHLDQVRSPKYTFKIVNTISEQGILKVEYMHLHPTRIRSASNLSILILSWVVAALPVYKGRDLPQNCWDGSCRAQKHMWIQGLPQARRLLYHSEHFPAQRIFNPLASALHFQCWKLYKGMT